MNTTEIVLKFNNTGSKALCAKCGELEDPPVGMWPFVEGTWDAVCMPCARSIAPDCPEWQAILDQCPLADPRPDMHPLPAPTVEERLARLETACAGIVRDHEFRQAIDHHPMPNGDC